MGRLRGLHLNSIVIGLLAVVAEFALVSASGAPLTVCRHGVTTVEG